MTPLSEPLELGAMQLRNRIVMSPLTRCRAPGRVPNSLMAEYYRQRASAGLIIAEATAVTPMGVGYPDTPGIWSKEQVEGWKPVVKAVHEKGGTIVLQLWHVGRISDPDYLGGVKPVAPSAIAADGHVNLLRPLRPFPVPRALETCEIPSIVEFYKKGAANALAAGFDGVDIHSANGYLLDQFLQDVSNKRTDNYGGPIENRARLLLEVVDAIVSVYGANRVGVHISPRGNKHSMGDSDPAATFGYVAKQLGKRHLAFLFVRELLDGKPPLTPELKKLFAGPVIANESYTRRTADEALRKCTADAVAWGQLYIANPDLAERMINGEPLNTPAPETFYGKDTKGYTDYPFLPR
jgi:2,4-dienoyl-CoA reductase-like NADH-dependent reductase (Old Yellow Enzyme family)